MDESNGTKDGGYVSSNDCKERWAEVAEEEDLKKRGKQKDQRDARWDEMKRLKGGRRKKKRGEEDEGEKMIMEEKR
ncbi:hypothetical protein F2P81_026378 [Scophthalmus maximus]|uniref:Uncharacterized protein n=1 Tax=Scophthalmus maximus TaxID=52904 RepID=A0A6A4RM67_SCOMX|nr:hypothetical protein F2P81_026378 [Scophthalmus maximus]